MKQPNIIMQTVSKEKTDNEILFYVDQIHFPQALMSNCPMNAN